MKQLPRNTVRGRIRDYIARHAHLLGDEVLEVGSRVPDPSAWWADNRAAFARGAWVGMDIEPGHGVDVIGDVERLPRDLYGRFSGVLCSEVLEHVERPERAARGLFAALRPGGHVVVTTLFAFPVHNYPRDYWRYSADGLRALLERAGFVDVLTEYDGAITVTLNDHGERTPTTARIPMHVFAVGRKPEAEAADAPPDPAE